MQDEISRRADTGERRGEGIATFPQDVVLHNARRPFAAASQCLWSNDVFRQSQTAREAFYRRQEKRGT